MLSQLLLPHGFGQYHLEPLGEPSACLGTLKKMEVWAAPSNWNIVELLFSFLSVTAREGFFHGRYIPGFLLTSLFTKPMLKYAPYDLFQGSTVAASASGAGREIPNNASAHHILKKFLPPLRGKILKKQNEDANMLFSGHIIRIHNLISVERIFTFRAFLNLKCLWKA